MTLLQAFLLSILQGATEFLPVSSSGHLVLAQNLFEAHLSGAEDVSFIVLAHVGTLVAIVWVFRRRIAQLVRYCFIDGPRLISAQGMRQAALLDPRGRLVTAIVLATAATSVMGFLGQTFFENLFSRPDRVGWALFITALLLVLSHGRGKTARVGANGTQTDKTFDLSLEVFPLWAGALVGVAQGVAIVPGISRSGSTIAVALLLGFSRRMAGDYSFLIAIPAIAAAGLHEASQGLAGEAAVGISITAAMVTLIASALSGYLFLRLLLRFVHGGQLAWFSLYCFAVGGWAIWRF